MKITPNSDGTVSVFVRLSAKKAAVFDSSSITNAITDMVHVVAEYCALTGEHPSAIIDVQMRALSA